MQKFRGIKAIKNIKIKNLVVRWGWGILVGTDIGRSLGIRGIVSRSLHGHCASSTRKNSSHVGTLFPTDRCCTGGILSGNIREGKWEFNLEHVVDSASAIVGHDGLKAA